MSNPRLVAARQQFVEEVMQSHTDECIMWPSPKGRGGLHGMTNFVLVCTLAHGEPPTSLHQVAHSCGNGHLGCVNPRHVRWATVKENSTDRYIHGTDCRGSKHGRALVDEDDVIRIRALHAAGTRNVDLADMFCVTRQMISAIVTRRNWKHI